MRKTYLRRGMIPPVEQSRWAPRGVDPVRHDEEGYVPHIRQLQPQRHCAFVEVEKGGL